MASKEEIHRERLRNEYLAMCRLPNSDMIQWKVADNDPTPDIPSHYVVMLKIHTIVGERAGKPLYRDQFVVDITLAEDYPFSKPRAHVREEPYPYHPNWWENGNWCSGDRHMAEDLAQFILRMARVMQFDPALTDLNSVANHTAVPFWNNNCHNSKIIPCDRQKLPEPKIARMVVRNHIS